MDTDGIAKAMMDPRMEQKKPEEKKPEEKVNEQRTPNPPKVDPPRNDDDNDMSLVEGAMGAGIGVNTRDLDKKSITRGELDKNYSEMAAEIGEKAQAKRDAVPKAVESAEKKEHNDEISRLENEYRTSTNEDVTAAMERVGTKEVLEVPNYREHVTDDQMQGWGRALASFGSVGLKQGANAIDAATKALGEFRKLTRAFLSPNPMSPISQTVASTMVGFNTMYDTIDKAGELAGVKQGADKSIVMETQKGAQYYKDKDNATKVANFIMQTFNDQIRDTLGPKGDVTQLNPAQFTRIYEKMKDGVFDSEMERIKDKHRTGQSLSLEDKAIIDGWENLNKNYKKVLKDKQDSANMYAKEIGGHEKAINALDKQYDKDVKAYDRAIAAIDKDEIAQQKSLGADYTRDSKSLDGNNRTVDAWKAGFDNAVKNRDSVGALIRMTLGPEAHRRLRDGNVLIETLKGAQDQANSNATNPNFTPEQQEKWLKIANVFGKRVQTVRNMSAEQRRQYARRLSGTANSAEGAPKGRGRTSNVDDDPLGLLGATKTQRIAIVKLTPKQYSDRKIAEWKKNHVLETDQTTSAKHRNLYEGAKDIVGKMAEVEREAYQNPRMSPEERADVLKRLEAYNDRLTDLEGVLWDRNELEANDVFDESYRKVYNDMSRDEYLKTLPKREREFPKSRGRSKLAKDYNVLIEDYETRKDELDMLRYDFLNGEFKDWRSRRNAILRGRHLNRLLDDERDRLSTMFTELSKAGKKNGMLPGHTFELPEQNEGAEQVSEEKEWEKGIDSMDESGLKDVIEYAAQNPTDEGLSQMSERAEKRLRELRSKVDSFKEYMAAQKNTEQENNVDETIDTNVKEELSVNDTGQDGENGDGMKTQDPELQNMMNVIDSQKDTSMLYDMVNQLLDEYSAGSMEKLPLIKYIWGRIDDLEKEGEGKPTSDTAESEPEEVFDTISKDLERLDKEGLEGRIAQLKGLDQDDPQVVDILRMAQERANAKQSENKEGPAVGPVAPESDDTNVSEKRVEPPVRTAYETTRAKSYSDKFEEILNLDISESKKRDRIGELLSDLNKDVEIIREEGVKKEFKRLQKEMNDMWNFFNKVDSSTFDREQQEQNEKNLKDAEENGLNPEHGEPFNANTSIDGSKITDPSDDPRKEDSKVLFKELPGNTIMPENIPAILRGIWPRGVETIDGKVSGKGQGNKLKGKLWGARNSLAKDVQDISKYEKAPTEKTINDLAKKRDDLKEAWKWVTNNMKNTQNYDELYRETFEVSGNPIDDASRLIDGSWTPWVKKSVPFEELLKARLNERYGYFTG